MINYVLQSELNDYTLCKLCEKPTSRTFVFENQANKKLLVPIYLRKSSYNHWKSTWIISKFGAKSNSIEVNNGKMINLSSSSISSNPRSLISSPDSSSSLSSAIMVVNNSFKWFSADAARYQKPTLWFMCYLCDCELLAVRGSQESSSKIFKYTRRRWAVNCVFKSCLNSGLVFLRDNDIKVLVERNPWTGSINW